MNSQQQPKITDFERDILQWLCHGEKTRSAETVALTLLGVPRKVIFQKNFCIYAPRNANDFRTCFIMVASVPGAHEQLDKLKTLGRVWTNVIANWDKLSKLYVEERLQGKQPKLDALLNDLNNRVAV